MALRALKHLDVVVLAVALAVFAATGLPLLGWAGAAFGWIAQRLLQAWVVGRASASKDVKTVAGLMTGGMIARGWIVAGSIFVVGLIEREAGLTAAILAIVLFTVYFTAQMFTRPFEEPRA